MKKVFSKWSNITGSSKEPVANNDVQSVIIVGGTDESKETDFNFLSDVLYDLKEKGVYLNNADGFFCDMEYGDDFVRDHPSADLIFLSWVNLEPLVWKNGTRYETVSPFLKKGYSWTEAFTKANPKYIGSTTNTSCVTHELYPDDYVCVSEDDLGLYRIYARPDIARVL